MSSHLRGCVAVYAVYCCLCCALYWHYVAVSAIQPPQPPESARPGQLFPQVVVEGWHEGYVAAAAISLLPFVTMSCILWAMSTSKKPRSPRLAMAVVRRDGWACYLVVHSVLFLALYVIICSQWSLVCAYRADELDNLCDFANRVKQELKDRQVGIWLTNGTLLPILRNESSTNYLLRTDHDFDVCYEAKDHKAILQYLLDAQIFYEPLHVNGVNKLRLFPATTRWHKGHSGPLMLDMEECAPTDLVQRVGCNHALWSVPRDAVEFVRSMFGATWTIPRTVNHPMACYLFPSW